MTTLNFNSTARTVTRMWSKKETQHMLQDMREQGLTVNKTAIGYDLLAPNGSLLLRAANGNSSYLLRMVDNLFA